MFVDGPYNLRHGLSPIQRRDQPLNGQRRAPADLCRRPSPWRGAGEGAYSRRPNSTSSTSRAYRPGPSCPNIDPTFSPHLSWFRARLWVRVFTRGNVTCNTYLMIETFDDPKHKQVEMKELIIKKMNRLLIQKILI